MTTTVFRARAIRTMSRFRPQATHVAVRDGRILGFGDAAEMAAFGASRIDDRFAGDVLLPGFVEGHSHMLEGLVWGEIYCGRFDRRDPEGAVQPGLPTVDAVVARLAAAPPGDTPVVGWGFDPLHVDRRLTRADLDRVSADRPVVVLHASLHVMVVNSVVLARIGYTRDTDLDGLCRDASGEPDGELRGPEAMGPVRRAAPAATLERAIGAEALGRFANLARRAGVTTATDLLSPLTPETVAEWRAATEAPDFPLRIVAALGARYYGLEEGVARWRELAGQSRDKLRFGPVKLVVDGSIQGFSARLRWPGYHDGSPNGMWYVAPAELATAVEAYHRAGAQLHIHTNGDEATEAALQALARAIALHPRPDHRHTLQHCQMADAAQFRRMAGMGVCVNLFANHLYYWGDAHVARTMGPTRAARLDACATALDAGVTLAIHCDAPITPLAPLFTAWCATTRQTASGRVLGAEERITAAQAVEAITLGAARTLHLDHLVGSIDVGKFADFAVLDADPLAPGAPELREIGVRGTVLGGAPYPA